MTQERRVNGEEHLHYHGVDKAEEHLRVGDALKILLDSIKQTKPELASLSESNGRVLFEDVKSPENLPKLARSTRDGYAVNITKDIENDTEYHAFKVVGEVRIGEVPKITVRIGQAARVATGSYIPSGSNAVVMVEYSNVEKNILRIAHPLRIGENIVTPGEDVKKGQVLLPKGSRVHPQHIALLSMLGVSKLRVFSKPRVAFFSTGDELEDSPYWTAKSTRKRAETKRNKFRTFDSNRPFLESILSELGAEPVDFGIARDNFGQMKSVLLKCLKYDAVILSAGSSVGERDFASRALESIRGVRILVHGVAMRPSSPTGLATYRGKPLILLPGFPTSAIVSFFVFGRPAVLKLSGCLSVQPPLIRAKMEEEYSGRRGVTHFVRVLVTKENDEYRARITKPTEAQYSSWLHVANGIAVIGENGNTSVKSGDEVSVFLIAEIPEGEATK